MVAPESPGLVASLRRLLGTLLETAQVRLDLIAVEIELEKQRLLTVLLLINTTCISGPPEARYITISPASLFARDGGRLSTFDARTRRSFYSLKSLVCAVEASRECVRDG
jgi:hypothetical protein